MLDTVHLISALLSQHRLVLVIALKAGYDTNHAEVRSLIVFVCSFSCYQSSDTTLEDTFQCQPKVLILGSTHSLSDQHRFDGETAASVTGNKE